MSNHKRRKVSKRIRLLGWLDHEEELNSLKMDRIQYDSELYLQEHYIMDTQWMLNWYKKCLPKVEQIEFVESKYDFALDPKDLALGVFYSMYNPNCQDKKTTEYCCDQFFNYFNITVDYSKGKGGYAEMAYWGLYMYLEVFLTICLSKNYTMASKIIPTFYICMAHQAARFFIYPKAWEIIAQMVNKDKFDFHTTDHIISFVGNQIDGHVFNIPYYKGCLSGDPKITDYDIEKHILIVTFYYKGFFYCEKEQVKDTKVKDLVTIDSLLFMTYYYLMLKKDLYTRNDIDLYVNCKQSCDNHYAFVSGRAEELFNFCKRVGERDKITLRPWSHIPGRGIGDVEWLEL